jgi:hypothetical protein
MKASLRSPWTELKNDNEIDRKESDLSTSGKGPMAVSRQYNNVRLGSLKGGEF